MTEPKTTLEEINKLITNYVDYAQSELNNSEVAYQNCDGKITRSSVIWARRGDIDVEICVSVTCKQFSKREI